jgi:hypothetical protein
MAVFVQNKKSEHFYEPDGTPAYGKNIVSARKLGLYPSMSSLNGLLDKYALTIWKMRQSAMAAIDAPKFDPENETREDYGSRVVNLAQENMEAAPGLGTDIHDLCEQYIAGKIDAKFVDEIEDARTKEIFIPMMKWIDEHIVPFGRANFLVEKTFADPELKIGGRIDLYGPIDGIPTLADFKTQDVKSGKVNWYDEWSYQLAGYRHGLTVGGYAINKAMSIVISTSDSLHGVEIREWSDKELDEAYRIVLALRHLYTLLKGV